MHRPDLGSFFRRLFGKVRENCPLCARDWAVSCGIILAASAICALLRTLSTSDVHVPLIFVTAVLVISLMTEGYFYGVLAAIVSVFGVNLVFTYPYFHLNFSITGYPLTFLTMLTVGVAVSTLTSRLKFQERARLESAKEGIRANLLRSVSHDLRTPLTSISGSIGAVLDSGGTLSESETRQLLTNAREDADWLYRMVENLLMVTRMNNNEIRGINRREELLEEILSEATAKFRRRTDKNVSVSVTVPEMPAFVPMDAMLIEQVIINLLDNALMHGGATEIEVAAEVNETFAEIRVRDNGRGIEKTLLPHLFDGTLTLANGDNTLQQGKMGIGLMVCRTIVEAHGGTIRAENPAGGGAQVTLTLAMEDRK